MSKKTSVLLIIIAVILLAGSYIGFRVYREQLAIGVSEFKASSQSCGGMGGDLCCMPGSICPQSGSTYSCPEGYSSLGDSAEPNSTNNCRPCCREGRVGADGEACATPVPDLILSIPVRLKYQCLPTSNTITWPDVAGYNARMNKLERSVDGGEFKTVFNYYLDNNHCRWMHSNGYLDTDVSAGHTYQYRHQIAKGVYSSVVTCPLTGPTPLPETVGGRGMSPRGADAICGKQLEELRKLGDEDLTGQSCCGTGYNLRFGHAGYDPASGLFWNVGVGAKWDDHTTWQWYKAPRLTDVYYWTRAGSGDFQGGPANPPRERPSRDAEQIRCFYSYYLYTQGKATWFDVTGGLNYDAYPAFGLCPGENGVCSPGVTPLPIVYKWHPTPSPLPTPLTSPAVPGTGVGVPTPLPTAPVVVNPKLLVDGATTSTKRQLESFTFSASGLYPSKAITRWIKTPGATSAIQISPMQTASSTGTLTWKFYPNCANAAGTYTVWVVDNTTGKKSNEVQEIVTQNSSCSGQAAKPTDYGLKEGDMISAFLYGDPDIFIVNNNGFKRLFLNEVIFGFYGHLGGFPSVKPVTTAVRDAFATSLLFKNCETNDSQVWALEVTGSDTGRLHRLDVAHEVAISQDPNFDKKTFCINNNEFNWYPKGTPYISLSQVK